MVTVTPFFLIWTAPSSAVVDLRRLYSPAQKNFGPVFNVSGSDLQQYKDQGYVVNDGLEGQYGEDANYTLSKVVLYDLDDLMAANLSLYGTAITRANDDGSITSAEACDAEFGDTMCNSCRICKIDRQPFTVTQLDVKFDCSGIVENRTCSGTLLSVQEQEDLAEGTTCKGIENGRESCFVDAAPIPTPAPTAFPTVSTSGGETKESSWLVGLASMFSLFAAILY